MGKSWNFLFSCNLFEEKVKLRRFLGYCTNILLTWMIMQRLLPLKQISTHHFKSLDTCYNWILGCCHLKAGNFGECWIFSTEFLTKKLKISFLYCLLHLFVLKCIEKKLKFFIFVLTSARKKIKLRFLANGKKLEFYIFWQPFEKKVKLRRFLGYFTNILLTWMIMQRQLPLKQISTHHFKSLDTCYNWIVGCCHLKAGNFGECWIFSTQFLTKKLKISFLYCLLHLFVLKCIEKKLKFFIFVLTSARKKIKLRFLAHGKKLEFYIFWQPFEKKVKLRRFLGYFTNILLTWMIMQRLLPLKKISTHHFNSLDTCYNWILGCCH